MVLNSDIDIGGCFQPAAIPSNRSEESIKIFKVFTSDLNEMADWLIQHNITNVAMESRAVYCEPVYEVLEKRGIDAILPNAKDIRSILDRKTDVNYVQWIQRLHANQKQIHECDIKIENVLALMPIDQPNPKVSLIKS